MTSTATNTNNFMFHLVIHSAGCHQHAGSGALPSSSINSGSYISIYYKFGRVATKFIICFKNYSMKTKTFSAKINVIAISVKMPNRKCIEKIKNA